MKTKKYYFNIGIALLIAFFVTMALAQHTGHNHQNHSTEGSFAEREIEVMPFDLDKTLHIFTDTIYGGKQEVVILDATNATEQLNLIREHLKMEAERFAKGDFGDPSYLHGESMAGLVEVSEAAKSGKLSVEYQELSDGAALLYSSDDPWVIIAVHLWFQAQVVDHGEHASSQRPSKTSTKSQFEVFPILALGEQLYQSTCAACHGSIGEGYANKAIPAPAVNGSEHAWHHPDEQILDLIANGGQNMPAIGAAWTQEEREAVWIYIKHWWTEDLRRMQSGELGEALLLEFKSTQE